MDKLDRERPFGRIYGYVPEKDQPTVFYEQDGTHFGPNGEVIEKWSTPERIAQEASQARKRKAKEEALAIKREEREKLRKLREEL